MSKPRTTQASDYGISSGPQHTHEGQVQGPHGSPMVSLKSKHGVFQKERRKEMEAWATSTVDVLCP